MVCGPSGSRQVDADQDRQRARAVPEGRDPRRRHLGRRPEDQPAEAALARRHGVPALRAVPAPDGDREPDARAGQGARPQPRGSAKRGLKLLDRVGLIAHKDKYPGPALRRPAAARGDRARAVDGPDRDAVRRADLGARPGDGQRGARRDGRAREGRHDDDGGHARDGLRPQGRATA